ncbi:hypothetical protein HanIR_Chr12g0585501 [Helianthus annuus]|nr:hypothetical protein HanIR_Chr12g0585501 [Helianthus annuus]
MTIIMDPTRPMGISRPGFLVSSPNVATPSNPTYAKKSTDEAFKTPRIPKGAKGWKLDVLAFVTPATIMKTMRVR